MLMISGLPWQLAGYWQDLVFYALLGGVQNIFCKATLTSAKYCTLWCTEFLLHCIAGPQDLIQMHNAVRWWKEQYESYYDAALFMQLYSYTVLCIAVLKLCSAEAGAGGKSRYWWSSTRPKSSSCQQTSQHSFHAHKFSWGIFQIRIFSTNIFGQ